MTIVWSYQSSLTYFEILDYLYFFWNEEIEYNFKEIVEKTTNQLLLNPYLGKPFSDSIRKIVLHKNASLYYEFDEKTQLLTILLFIDNRQNPKDYLKLL